MFEGFARGRSGKNRWKAPLIASGTLLHVALFTGMWINGLWEIKKVEAAEEALTLTAMVPIPKVDNPGKPSNPPKQKEPKHKVVKDPHQPEEKKDTPPPATEPMPPGDEEEPPGNGPGDDDGIKDGVPDTQNVPPVELPKEPEPPKPLPVPARPAMVLPSVLERTFGEKLILPDAETAQQIARAEMGEIRGSVRLCLGTDGTVRSAAIVRSTKLAAYDAKLEGEMSKWRYRPYQVNGVATPVCTTITVIYKQR